jgi:uncharacterized protein YdeI (YjbR/CyaY-like superfamily)
MGVKDPRIDAYIGKSADFARPILEHLRELIHITCPDVVENIKWGFPHFEYKGMFCGMAAFKQHCAFDFWKAAIMKDPYGFLITSDKDAMGHLGRITSLSDLPPRKHLVAYLKQAMDLNDRGVSLATVRKAGNKAKKKLKVPDEILRALKKNKKARDTFEKFSYSHKKEYIEWITEAKTEETRSKRISTMLEWLSEGKPRNWKYMRK